MKLTTSFAATLALILTVSGCVTTTNNRQIITTTTAPDTRTSEPQGTGTSSAHHDHQHDTPAQVTRPKAEQKIGDEAHPKIVAQYGLYENPAITAYVDQLGRQLIQKTSQADEEWKFTVLDSPEINAFALPGGYIYVTRGLMALANSEAELAGVIGHEIAHVVAGHGAKREKKADLAQMRVVLATVLGGVLAGESGAKAGSEISNLLAAGQVAQYSQKQEFEADRLGVRYLAKSGFDPYAQADFLDSMASKKALDSSLEGGDYNPNQVNFFSTHPATGLRVREAIGEAQSQSAQSDVRNAARYLRIIDDLPFGPDPDQGIIEEQTFWYPKLGLTFEVPQNFQIRNEPDRVLVLGEYGARMLFTDAQDVPGSLADYLRNVVHPNLASRYQAGRPSRVITSSHNGVTTSSMDFTMVVDGTLYDTRLSVLRWKGIIFRFHALGPRGGNTQERLRAQNIVRTFRAMTKAEISRLKPLYIETYQVKPGDTVSRLAQKMQGLPKPVAQFRVLNGLEEGEGLKAGQLVKLVRY